jgi:hypothetical protein
VLFKRQLLLKMYAAIYPHANARAARFGEWLTRGAGRQLVANYRVQGHPAFTVWLEGCPDSYQEERPCRASATGKPIKDHVITVDGSGPPPTLQQMVSDADAVIVARYTGRSREFPGPASPGTGPALPGFERLGAFEILEVVKPHPAVPDAGGDVEIVVPGSYQEFPSYILHTADADVGEPVAGRTYVIFVRHRGSLSEGNLRPVWFKHGMYDVSGDRVTSLGRPWLAFRDQTPAQFLAALRREAVIGVQPK